MEKLYNKGLNIYTLAEDKARLAVDFRRESVQPVPVGVRAAATGHYQFVVKNNSLWNANELYLCDNKLHTDTRMNNGAVYEFAIGEQEVGSSERRFEIINKSLAKQTQTLTQSFSATLLGNIINGQGAIRVMVQNSEDTQVSKEIRCSK
ncbi:hypothetical protein QEG73_22830 [Chitinophagaceae bacterium 26-R-25]|nr:hypothetical protein [Chitinophagaceae bacterium 26-R-25]